MKRAIPAPTKAQQKRQDIIRELGCIACWLSGRSHEPCDIQHMNDRGRNISQDHTFGLCPWHHRGICKINVSPNAMYTIFGPSFAVQRAEFRDRYGSDQELLDYQNIVIEATKAARDHPLVIR